MKKIALIIILTLTAAALSLGAAGCAGGGKIIFVVDGARYAESTIGAGYEITLPADPAKDGYAFMGWFTDGEEELTQEYVKSQEITKEVSVFAKWAPAITVEGGVVTGLTLEGRSQAHLVIPSTFDGQAVTAIGVNAFARCADLKKVVVSNGIEVIGRFAFYFCTGLEEVVVGDSVTKVEKGAFQGCSALRAISFGTGVTEFGSSVLTDCGRLESLTVPFIGERADGTGATNLGYLFGVESFFGHTGSKMPKQLHSLSVTNTDKIDAFAVYNCKSLTSLNLTGSLVEIGECAFKGCTGITEINLPDTVQKLGFSAFANCKSATTLRLSDSLTEIGAYAFYNVACARVEIPSAVEYIGKSAFKDCNELTSVAFSDASGWQTDGAAVSEAILTDEAQAAALLSGLKRQAMTREG